MEFNRIVSIASRLERRPVLKRKLLVYSWSSIAPNNSRFLNGREICRICLQWRENELAISINGHTTLDSTIIRRRILTNVWVIFCQKRQVLPPSNFLEVFAFRTLIHCSPSKTIRMALHQVQNLTPGAIFTALSDLELGGSEPYVDGEFQGGECRIFKVSFKDHPSLSVRVCHPGQGNHQNIIARVDMETRIFSDARGKRFPLVPSLPRLQPNLWQPDRVSVRRARLGWRQPSEMGWQFPITAYSR